MYDCLIIGAGPAGLSAAVYAKRAGLNALVIEKAPVCGGQILNTYEVDNYLGLPGISGWDMGQTFKEHAQKMGVSFVEEEVEKITNAGSIKTVKTDQNEYETKTVILATGAHHALLGIPGEEELTGMGVSYCATCDGAFFKNREVAVVGGGDVAVEDAIFLARTCKKVTLIHRRDELRAAKALQEALQEYDNVEILYSHVPLEIRGEDSITGFLIRDLKTEQEKELKVQGVFIAVGIHPDTELLQGLVSMDAAGYVNAPETGETDCPGIFVAGDCRKKPMRQVITAVADGANAATAALSYVSKL